MLNVISVLQDKYVILSCKRCNSSSNVDSYFSDVKAKLQYFDVWINRCVDSDTNLLSRRSYGGTAILCRQNLAACVKLVDSQNSRITAIEIMYPLTTC
jgi:hypothetical protein